MSNTLTNVIPQLLAQGLLALREFSIMPRLVNRNYDLMASQHGATITIPIPSAVAVQSVVAAATPATNTQLSPTYASIEMSSWEEAPFTLSDKELMEAMTGTIPMQASEAIKALANKVDGDIMTLYKKVYGCAGTAGTTPFASTIADATAVRKVLNNQLAALNDRRMVIDADAEANALSLQAFYDMSMSGSAQGLIEGQINRKLGFDWFMSQNVPSHLCGARGATSYAINNATTTVGMTQCAIDTGTGDIHEGEIFTVAGDTQTYTTLTGCTTTLLKFSPASKVAWANDAVVTFKGAANSTYSVNLGFHRDAFAFVTRPLADNTDGLGNMIQAAVDPVSGLTLRLEVSREHRRTRFAYDILYGFACVRPELACRLLG
jgi:hypothetical protein